MSSPAFFNSYRPDKTSAHAIHGKQLAVLYKDIDGFFGMTQDNVPSLPRTRGTEPGHVQGQEYYLAAPGHCSHFPQRGLRKGARS